MSIMLFLDMQLMGGAMSTLATTLVSQIIADEA